MHDHELDRRPTQVAPDTDATTFTGQRELVAEQLTIVRARIEVAIAARSGVRAKASFTPADLDNAEAHVTERARASRAAGIPLPLLWLEERLALAPTALRVLWILIAHEVCPIARGLLRELNTENCADPTTDTLRTVAFSSAMDADAHRLFTSASPLVSARLIERTDADAHAPDHRKTWKVAGRIVALAHESLHLDPELERIATVVRRSARRIGIADAGIEAAEDILPALIAAMRNLSSGRTLVLQGARGSGRRSLLRVAAAACETDLLEIDLTRLEASPGAARQQLATIARECRLLRLVPLLRDLDALAETAPQAEHSMPPTVAVDRIDLITDSLEELPALATTSKVIPGNRLQRPQIIELPPITSAQRATLWHRAMPEIDVASADLLATMYPVVPSLIDAASTVARAQAPGTGQIHAHIRTGLRAVLDGRLAGLAHRIEGSQEWNALVLPADQREAIDELIARVTQRRTVYESWELGRHFGRGLGVSALFSGPPGTGKTMAAGLIAMELSTDIYQVDMSKIVSKWIGETEKNIAALFEAAEAGHAILLFDEADALFGKRTEVKSSNDRHANQETNFLLQRLETFKGVCLLTTNNDAAIDEAFRRRISFHVHFPMPDAEEREQLWKSMLRHTIPTEGKLDFAALASRYEMSGGHIRNSVLRAAFAAASANCPVNNKLLQRAAQVEYQAMGRVLPSTL
jgi:hypothetical protein